MKRCSNCTSPLQPVLERGPREQCFGIRKIRKPRAEMPVPRRRRSQQQQHRAIRLVLIQRALGLRGEHFAAVDLVGPGLHSRERQADAGEADQHQRGGHGQRGAAALGAHALGFAVTQIVEGEAREASEQAQRPFSEAS